MTANPEPKPRKIPWATLLLGVGLVIALVGNVYQHSSLVNLQMDIKGMQREMTSLRDIVSSSDKSMLQTIDSLRSDLDVTRKTTVEGVGAAKQVARKQAELVATRLAKQQEEQRKQLTEHFTEKIDEVKTSNQQASADLNNKLTDISSNVGNVRTEVATARTEIDKTIADLRRVTGDMGIMSGLIATNAKELAALRELGEKNYYEFRIGKTKAPQKLADIQVVLKRTDLKRNRFTVEIIADDKRVEKKDRTVNEPVQFYVLSKGRQPYEFVVNEVKNDQITGYLATPKLRLARN